MAEPSTSALLTGSRHVEGVALITSAALLFGILAAVVKSVTANATDAADTSRNERPL